MKKQSTILALFLTVICVATATAQFSGELDRGFAPNSDRTDLVRPRAVAVQPDGRFLVGGTFHKVGSRQVNHVARFNSDGSVDTTFDSAGTIVRSSFGDVNVLAVQPDGKIIVGGGFDIVGSTARRRLARLNPNGTFDPTFAPPVAAAAGSIVALAVQPDGKILVYGASAFTGRDFTRLNADGTLDTTFAPSTAIVNSIAVLPSGKILITGSSFTFGAETRTGIARLNSDGTLDTTFANLNMSGTVFRVAPRPDGKIWIGGSFNTINGQQYRRIALLNEDGSIDASFTNNVSRNVDGRHLAPQSDGKIVYCGSGTPIFRDNADGTPDTAFATRSRILTSLDVVASLPNDRVLALGYTMVYNSDPPNTNIVRRQPIVVLGADGTMDRSINPDVVYSVGYNPIDIEVQPDGKILLADVSRTFDELPGLNPPRIVRYNNDGSIDSTFTSPTSIVGSGTAVRQIALQTDGKILLSTEFGTTRPVIRLNADGSEDTSFQTTFNGSGSVLRLEIQPDGKILCVGTFTQINGQPRNGFARLNTDGSLDALNPSFLSGTTPQPPGYLVLAPAGKFYVGGTFDTVNGSTRPNIARFNADGSVDSAFTMAALFLNQFNVLAAQPDGKILVGSVGGIGRYNTDGSVDTSFAVLRFRLNVSTPATPIAANVMPNGKIIVGGAFQTVDGLPRRGYARLNSDGALDSGFGVNGGASGGDGVVYRIALESDGDVLIGGRFAYVNNISQPTIARLKQSVIGARPFADFDGDGRTDAAVFRSGSWFVNPSNAAGTFFSTPFGLATDKLAPADYDGDGKTDLAVWRETDGNFYILNSSNAAARVENFGLAGDIPLPGDFDGDGKADLATYREATQSYFFYRGSLNNPSGNITYLPWGTSGDKAVRGDFDGDGKLDPAVFRTSSAQWIIRRSSDGQIVYRNFGLATDTRVTGDFDGDAKTDIAVFRDGVWYILQSSNDQVRIANWGLATDVPAAGDYDGDGKTDVAVFRNGVFYVFASASSLPLYINFGASGDIAVAASANP